jgi:hypothetical protein
VTLGSLREVCERQAEEIRDLNESLDVFRRGAHALSLRNAELRANIALIRAIVHTRCPMPRAQVWETDLPVSDDMASASRSAVADALGDRVPHGVLRRAQAIVAEVLADRRCQRGADLQPPMVLRIESSATAVRVELDDHGTRAPATDDGSVSLAVIEQLSERWGGERLDTGGVRIWAQLTLLDLVDDE